MDDQRRGIALYLAIKASPGKPIEELIRDAEKVLAWLSPGAPVKQMPTAVK